MVHELACGISGFGPCPKLDAAVQDLAWTVFSGLATVLGTITLAALVVGATGALGIELGKRLVRKAARS